MKFSTALSAALCASSAIAAPRRKYHPKHVGNSHPLVLHHTTSRVNGTKGDEYSSNWSGAIVNAASGETITGVRATFTVPQPAVPDGQPAGQYSGVAWVGIDGTTSGASLWQAGAEWVVDTTSGSPQYHYAVWYEWLPNYLIEVPDFPVNAGDVISVDLVSTSSTTGTVVIADETTGQTTTIATSAPAPTATLVGATAEWITEDLTISSGLAPFANYGSVTYTGVGYDSSSGGGDVSNGAVIDLTDSSGNIISQGGIPSGGQVDTNYV